MGMQLWRSFDGAEWEIVFKGGNGKRGETAAMQLFVFDDKLFIGTMNWFRGMGLFANPDAEGTHFEAVFENGLARWRNTYIWLLAEFQGRLYLGVFNSDYFHVTNAGGIELLSSADP